MVKEITILITGDKGTRKKQLAKKIRKMLEMTKFTGDGLWSTIKSSTSLRRVFVDKFLFDKSRRIVV